PQEPGRQHEPVRPQPRHDVRAQEPVRPPARDAHAQRPVRAPEPVHAQEPVRGHESVRPQAPPPRRQAAQPLPPERPAQSQGSPWFRPHEQPEPAAPGPPAQNRVPRPPQPPPADGGTLTFDLGPDFAAAVAPHRAEAEEAVDDRTVALRRIDADAPPTAAVTDAGTAPPTGGRAARRKAAQDAARRGGRGRRTPSPAPAPESDPAAPRTRLEARRAQRARKETPGVIVSRLLGEGFITIGVLMLLFVTYQLWWTNVIAHQQAGGAANSLRHKWDEGDGDDRSAGAFSPGQGFAIIYIPKLDVKAPIAEGISKPKVLDRGMVGHYADGGLKTAMPWDKKGNFALAGHRNTHGEPFRYINQLKPGDKVVVETKSAYFTYEMTSALPQTSPSNTSVIRPVPTGSGFTKPGRYITLTTCTPEFTSTYRMIVWGKMVDERPRSKGKPDALVE
ncbi:class E sortase, partial [Streptomyces sp. NPDC057654]|uniref:class E sortase n=1 Tax=Streptomyces sp. NPDC057654 TaxID=3346196 RepID=UPI00368E59AA